MMSALYRQYRPQQFSELIGQEHITATLQQAILSQHVAHAYLFHGPRGTGKTTTARILARRLNCQEPVSAEPCGTCPACAAARESRLLDVVEIDAASNRGIDDIRALQEGVALSPGLGTYKIYIIDEVHMLTKEAFTALLKTLEEPAARVVFILASTEFHKIPETVISRCQVFQFRRASEADMKQRLTFLLKQEKRIVDDAALSFIIQRSDGCYRDAESLLGQALTLHPGTITYEVVASFLGLPPADLLNQWLTALIQGESASALAAVDQVLALGFDAEHFIQESIRAARDGALRLIKDEPLAQKFTFQTEPGAPEALPRIIRALVQAMQDMAYVPEPSIAVHLVIVTICTKQGAMVGRPVEPPRPARPVRPANPPKVTPVDQKDNVTSIVKLWPQVIARVKEENPVASTFLRALKPISYRDGAVHLEARYGLHQTFFEKPDNQHLLNAAVSELLKTPVTVRCVLQEEATHSASSGEEHKHQEQVLMSAVKEVFGK